jgi:hypothetical protein
MPDMSEGGLFWQRQHPPSGSGMQYWGWNATPAQTVATDFGTPCTRTAGGGLSAPESVAVTGGAAVLGPTFSRGPNAAMFSITTTPLVLS